MGMATGTEPKVTSGRTVTAVWRGGYHCTVEAGSFRVEVDEPAEVGGSDLGPQPTDLFLGSVASCFLLALNYAAQKQSVELSDLEVRVTGTYEGLRFGAVHVQASVGVPEPELERLMRTARRVCYVTNTMHAGVELTIEAHVPGA
jgi:uncharacterized OsmC-like protein